MERAIKWEIAEDLDVPCADISYQWNSEAKALLVVTMHFSRVINGYGKDLELIFERPLALNWEDESYSLIGLPNNLPKCSSKQFNGWTYPTLIVTGSKWADLYAARTHTEEKFKTHGVTHFAFIAMNDLLHILSEKKPSTRFIGAKDA
jgi:hypothetical protein